MVFFHSNRKITSVSAFIPCCSLPCIKYPFQIIQEQNISNGNRLFLFPIQSVLGLLFFIVAIAIFTFPLCSHPSLQQSYFDAVSGLRPSVAAFCPQANYKWSFAVFLFSPKWWLRTQILQWIDNWAEFLLCFWPWSVFLYIYFLYYGLNWGACTCRAHAISAHFCSF